MDTEKDAVIIRAPTPGPTPGENPPVPEKAPVYVDSQGLGLHHPLHHLLHPRGARCLALPEEATVCVDGQDLGGTVPSPPRERRSTSTARASDFFILI